MPDTTLDPEAPDYGLSEVISGYVVSNPLTGELQGEAGLVYWSRLTARLHETDDLVGLKISRYCPNNPDISGQPIAGWLIGDKSFRCTIAQWEIRQSHTSLFRIEVRATNEVLAGWVAALLRSRL